MLKSDYYRRNKKSVLTAHCDMTKTRKDAKIKNVEYMVNKFW